MPSSEPSPGFLDYTTDVLASPDGDRALIEAATAAVGLASLANTSGGTHGSLMRQARACYADAIVRVNKALTHLDVARNYSSLLAVLVLGLFETVTCIGDQSLDAWTRHVHGAADLLVCRGIGQFCSAMGLHIFQEAMSHLMVCCARLGCGVPPRLRLLRAKAAAHIESDSPAWVLSSAHVEVMELFHRVDMDCQDPCLPYDWERMLAVALEVDRRLETRFRFDALPAPWRYKAVIDPDTSARVVYQGTYHVYYDAWVAKVWDGMRSCRIMAQLIVAVLLLREARVWAPVDTEPGGSCHGLLTQAMETMARLCDDILASVLQMLGYVYHDVASGTSYLNCNNGSQSHSNFAASGPYFLLWNLYLAGGLPLNSAETREWVVDRLLAIREMAGIQKAGYLAAHLQTGPLFSAQIYAL